MSTIWQKNIACNVVVVVPQDGAWNKDPFAASADYRLAESSRTGAMADYTVRRARGRGNDQMPANQLKPCLLQNVSRKSLVTSIALIHFAFL